MMNAISLFSGIGGIDLAMSYAGFNIVAQVEINEYCRKVLKYHAEQHWGNAQSKNSNRKSPNIPDQVNVKAGNYLNPAWELQLMGFPDGWLDIDE